MRFLISLLTLTLLTSCASVRKENVDYQEAGTLWLQSSAEAKALIYQAFNIARLRLDQDLKRKGRKYNSKKRAIVVDVDETIVDNSPYQAKNILIGREYTSSNWAEWIDLANAKALPGAVEFLNYAKSRGVEVFFITNRKVRGYDATLKNLKELGFPVTKKNLFLREGKSHSKEVRRQRVLKTHRFVLLMGDTLGDFGPFFEKQSFDKRDKLVDQYRQEFGRKFIILPNPMYGEWLGSVYDYNYELSNSAKKKIRRSKLKPY
jgi:5'-nucleotidase (lipoprotein e(P4) family)